MITQQELDRLKELEKSAIRGPWEYTAGEIISFVEKRGEVCVLFQLHYGEKIDGLLIAESRNLLPKLIESFEVMRDALTDIEDAADGYNMTGIEKFVRDTAKIALSKAIGEK